MRSNSVTIPAFKHTFAPAAALCALLAGCGGGGSSSTSDPTAPAVSPSSLNAAPTFVRVAVDVPEPPDASASAASLPLSDGVSVQFPLVHGSQTPVSPMSFADASQAASPASLDNAQTASAQSVSPPISVSFFTPPQIRQAYGLSGLPLTYSGLTPDRAASLGAGQTIYVVSAYQYPSALNDLNVFSQKFGLPVCSSYSVTAASLPLRPPMTDRCEFAVVRAQADATRPRTVVFSPSAPLYDRTWAFEQAVDIQWAHAIAPLARIVLIEVPNTASNQLLAGVQMANSMGPGVVSMSFAAGEFSAMGDDFFWAFRTPGMSYVAASGDWGSIVNWPSNDSNVLAVGGTSLQYNGGTRTEYAWQWTGGGVSLAVPIPDYQQPFALRTQTLTINSRTRQMRGVADVSFNGNPLTGQYSVMTYPGQVNGTWAATGGTSVGTPQWAGLIALANARRASIGKQPLGGNLHRALYGLAADPAKYSAAFQDVTAGSNGTCGYCFTGVGYDTPTGLGTPNAGALIPMLAAY